MDNCPKCNSSWIDETHWRRDIGIDGGWLGIYDGIVAIRCPDCDEEFPRDDSTWAADLFAKYIRSVKESK